MGKVRLTVVDTQTIHKISQRYLLLR